MKGIGSLLRKIGGLWFSDEKTADAESPIFEVLEFTLPKLGEDADSNADYCTWNRSAGRYVIADGVSQSFEPRVWARTISNHAVKTGAVISPHEMELLAAKLSSPALSDESWFVSEMRDRGSQSTILFAEIRLINNQVIVRLNSIGDCCAFLFRDGRVVISWPYISAADFPFHPFAVSTKPPFISGDIDECEWVLEPSDQLVLATDAMSRFLVTAVERNASIDLESVFPFFAPGVPQHEIFSEWADLARRGGSLEDDDLTIMMISSQTRLAHA